jgi:hypothetical protein
LHTSRIRRTWIAVPALLFIIAPGTPGRSRKFASGRATSAEQPHPYSATLFDDFRLTDAGQRS